MNLHRLEVFQAVAETGSFSRAAEKMFLTQSTVSQHIAGLEEELAVHLFDRTGRGAELTEGGKLLGEHVRRILVECADLNQSMARFRGLDDTLLTVGASNIPANYLIPQLLTVMGGRHPGVTLNVLTGDSRDMIGLLAAGEVALAVVGNRFEDDGVAYAPLTGDSLQLVIGAGHPWRGRLEVGLEELVATPMLVRESGSGSGRAVEAALQAAGLDIRRLQVIARLGSNEAIKQAVCRGTAAAFLSSLSVQRELQCGEMMALPVAGLSISRSFWLATRRGRTLSPATRAFATLLEETFGNDEATR